MKGKKGVLIVDLGMSHHPNLEYIQRNLANYLSNQKVLRFEQMIWNEKLGVVVEFKNVKKIKAVDILTADKIDISRSSCADVAAIEIGLVSSENFFEIKTELDRLFRKNISELVVIPMFSQYSQGAVEQLLDRVTEYFVDININATLKFVRSFANHPSYIDYFVKKINQEMHKQNDKIDAVVFTYPVIPDFWQERSDYYCQCETMTKRILDKIEEVPYYQTYQPEFGSVEHIGHTTPDVLRALAETNQKNILVVAPRLVLDCFDVAKQVEETNKHIFYANGGCSFKTIFPFMKEEEMTALFAKLVE